MRLPTPSSRWKEEGIADPHGDVYDCERVDLPCGHMTDDELANALAFQPSAALLKAARDRIRWLSRQLEKK